MHVRMYVCTQWGWVKADILKTSAESGLGTNTCCQTDCGGWSENQMEGNKRKERKVHFVFFNMCVWTCRTSAKTERKHQQLFLTQVKLTNGLDFPILCDFLLDTPEFYCLALTRGRKKEGTHTFAAGRLCLPVAAGMRRALPICLHASSSVLKEAGGTRPGSRSLQEENAFRRETCEDQWRDGTFYSPLSPSKPFLGGMRIWEALLKGGGSFFEDHIMP